MFVPGCIPEKRSGEYRLIGPDRRVKKEDFVIIFEPKRKTDKYVNLLECVRGLFHGVYFGSLLWGIIIILVVFIRPGRTYRAMAGE
jgi:hypothetical protein